MQSPKFAFIKNDLDEAFSASHLKEEWKKRVKQQIRKQLIFDAIEYRDIDAQISSTINRIRRDILSGDYVVRQPKRYLVEKSKGLCRQMTLINPKDLLVLERLSRSIYFELKEKAPSEFAFFEPDDGSFSKGFKQDDIEYGSFASWKKFQSSVFGFADENKFIVVTDVANFYDFINFQHLRNIVASLAEIRESLLDLLIYVLNRLTWTPDFMPLSQTGMPQIETTATRVLANAMLYEVDQVCEAAAVSNYARFMDDMDVGVNSIAKAKRIIRDMDLTLQSRQLRLNSSKTQILSQKDAYDHFRIAENAELAQIDKFIERGILKNLVGKIILLRYERWLNRSPKNGPGTGSRFVGGNGNKIHKYTLSLLYQSGQQAPEEDLLWLIQNDPGMRPTALRYLANSRRNNSNLNFIIATLKRDTFVDDASLVNIAGFLLHSRFRKTKRCEQNIGAFCDYAAQQSDIGLHSAIFTSSKFLGTKRTLEILRRYRSRLVGDFWLARATAGLAPIFKDTSDWSAYHDIVADLDSDDAQDVFKYLVDAMSAPTFSQSMKAYLAAPNPSFPQKVYFPKVLHLLAACKNPNASSLLPALHATHPALLSDPYFKAMGF